MQDLLLTSSVTDSLNSILGFLLDFHIFVCFSYSLPSFFPLPPFLPPSFFSSLFSFLHLIFSFLCTFSFFYSGFFFSFSFFLYLPNWESCSHNEGPFLHNIHKNHIHFSLLLSLPDLLILGIWFPSTVPLPQLLGSTYLLNLQAQTSFHLPLASN